MEVKGQVMQSIVLGGEWGGGGLAKPSRMQRGNHPCSPIYDNCDWLISKVGTFTIGSN